MLIVDEHEGLTLESAVVKLAPLNDTELPRLLSSVAYAPQRCLAGAEF